MCRNSYVSIDFLSTENTVSSWIAHGNASPANAYRNGQIDDIPFNIDAIDFVDYSLEIKQLISGMGITSKIFEELKKSGIL